MQRDERPSAIGGDTVAHQLKREAADEINLLHERAQRRRIPPPSSFVSEVSAEDVALYARDRTARELADSTLAEVRAEAAADQAVVAAKAEAARLATALEAAAAEHDTAAGALPALTVAVERAVIAGSGIEAAERAQRDGNALVEKLANRVEVLTRARIDAEGHAKRTEAETVRQRAQARVEHARAAGTEAEQRLAETKERHAKELAAALDDEAVTGAVLNALARAARPAGE